MRLANFAVVRHFGNMSVIEITDQDFESVFAANKVVIVDVFASWCGSCRMFAPLFDEVAQANNDFKFTKVDGEKNSKFIERIEADNLPFVCAFVNGEYVGGKSISKKDALEEMVKVIRSRV